MSPGQARSHAVLTVSIVCGDVKARPGLSVRRVDNGRERTPLGRGAQDGEGAARATPRLSACVPLACLGPGHERLPCALPHPDDTIGAKDGLSLGM